MKRMDTISITTDTWVPVENERATKEGYVLWVKPGKFGQLHCLTPKHAPPPHEDKGGFYNLDLLLYLTEMGVYAMRSDDPKYRDVCIDGTGKYTGYIREIGTR